MGVTIKEIAEEAKVSIATVSHALNKTRYVSPEIAERVLTIAKEKGYVGKHSGNGKLQKYHVGKMSEMALVIPNTFSVVYTRLISELTRCVDEQGYMLGIYLSGGDEEREKHILREVIANKRVAGVLFCPAALEKKKYEKLLSTGKPLVCLERTIEGMELDCVMSDNFQGMKEAASHLIKCGHERIVLLLEDKFLTTMKERREGYLEALSFYHIPQDKGMVASVNLEDERETVRQITEFIREKEPTAMLAGGYTLTLRCLKAIQAMGLECPKDISIVGFGDDAWSELVSPALTVLIQNTAEIARQAVNRLLDKISNPFEVNLAGRVLIPMELKVRKSALNIARGPFGEKIVYPEDNYLTEEEAAALRKGNYTVAISFHYTGNEWTRLHEKAIKDTLSSMGVRVLTVADSNFDPDLQNTQLEGIMMQKPDAVIAVPVDEEKTAEKFKELAGKTKLILINNMPVSLNQEDYECWISVNERENGQNVARILKEHFEGREKVKVGMLIHGTPFFATRQRDFFAEMTFEDQCPNIEIVAKESFGTIENAYSVCRKMMTEHPDIEGLYVTWDRPALQAIHALEDMGIQNVAVATTDLDYEIASYLVKGKYVVGLSSQRPYDQGIAVATATAKALLGKNENRCIGVPPYTVVADNIEKAWKEILKMRMPDWDETSQRDFY